MDSSVRTERTPTSTKPRESSTRALTQRDAAGDGGSGDRLEQRALVVFLAAALRPELRKGLLRVIPPALVGLALFLPWGLTGFRAQLSHELLSGGTSGIYANLTGYCQSIAHFLFVNTSLGGSWLTFGLALPGLLVGAIVAALGIARLWKMRREGSGLLLVLLVAVGLLVPAWGGLFSILAPRAGYSWRYVAGSCVPVLLLLAAGIRWRPWPRLALSSLLVFTLGATTLVLFLLPGQEDYRGAIAHILRNARPGDAVITRPMRDVDPASAPTGWPYYLGRVERPASLAPGDEPVEVRLPMHGPALEHARVWVYIRYRFPAEVLADLEVRYDSHEVTPIGSVLTVHLFSREPTRWSGEHRRTRAWPLAAPTTPLWILFGAPAQRKDTDRGTSR